jgi:hypothetical protein
LITKEKLERILDAQRKITAGQMTVEDARNFLQQDNSQGLPVSKEMPEEFVDLRHLGQAIFGVPDLLIRGKVITHSQANSAQAEAIRSELPLEQVLLARGLIDSNVLDIAKRCIVLHGKKTITTEEAILVLNAWLSKRDQAIDDVLARIAQRDLA